MKFLLTHQWSIFITIEILSLVFLLLFFITRYIFMKLHSSTVFLVSFITTIILEAFLAYIVYSQTGEFTTFQIVIAIFILYAATFGRSDFKKFDRFARDMIGKWKGVDLLTTEDREIMAYLKNPKVVAKRARYWFYAHITIYAIAILVFWTLYGNPDYPLSHFLTNFEWFGDETIQPQPFQNELLSNIVRIWSVIFIVDSIINWSYTIFPTKKPSSHS